MGRLCAYENLVPSYDSHKNWIQMFYMINVFTCHLMPEIHLKNESIGKILLSLEAFHI